MPAPTGLSTLRPDDCPVRRSLLAVRPDRSSPVPVYAQIVEGVRAVLAGAEAQVGTPLPPERVLCERYGVSRMTLRQAFEVLEREGLIETQRGRGTFVAPPRLTKQQQEMRSFTEEIRSRGGTPSSRLLWLRVQPASAAARGFFGLGPEEQVFEIRRLRYRDGEPLALETVEIPCRLCPGLDRFDLARESLYRILEQEYGLTLGHCVEEISAARPGRIHRKLFGEPAPPVLLVIQRKTYTATDTPVELGVTVYRGDAYSAIVRSTRARG